MARKGTKVFAQGGYRGHLGRTIVRYEESGNPWVYISAIAKAFPQDLKKILAKIGDVYRKNIQNAMKKGQTSTQALAPLHPVTVALRGNNPGGNLKRLVRATKINDDKMIIGVHDPKTMPLMARYQTRHLVRMMPWILGRLRDKKGSEFVDENYPRDRTLLREVSARPIIADIAADPQTAQAAAKAVYARINGIVKGAEKIARKDLARKGASEADINRVIATLSAANQQAEAQINANN